MYAIIPLDPETAPRFERLAPYHVRPLLAELRMLPRVALRGAVLMDEPVGLAVVARDMPAVRDGRIVSTRRARLLSLTVARSYRRIGVGTALLRAVESAVATAGADELSFSYALTGEQLGAAEAFFARAGWTPPEMTMLHCRADRAMLRAPLMQDALALPPEYEICDWIDVTDAEREAIAARQAEGNGYPPELDPFHFERGLELLNSLALRYRGEVVGWLLTSRTGPTTIHYRCLFVRPDLARLGRGLAMVVEAIRRQQEHWDTFAPDAGHGEWGTPATLPAMVRFIRRHLAPYTQVTERRAVRTTFGSPMNGTAGTRTPPAADVRVLDVLDRAQCVAIRDDVRALRPAWVRRQRTPRFHTLGRSVDFDGGLEANEFSAEVKRSNALLHERFPALYDAVVSALARALEAPVRLHESLPAPGFLILEDERGARLPIAPIRCDYPPMSLSRGSAWPEPPLSFVLTVATPAAAPADVVTIWPLDAEQTVGLDTDEIDRLIDAGQPRTQRAAIGQLVLFSGLSYHQQTPLGAVGSGERITLEGRAFRTGTSWELYW